MIIFQHLLCTHARAVNAPKHILFFKNEENNYVCNFAPGVLKVSLIFAYDVKLFHFIFVVRFTAVSQLSQR